MNPDAVKMFVPSLVTEHVGMLVCPACDGRMSLARSQESLECVSCQWCFSSEQGIPLLFWPNEWPPNLNDVTETVKAFYEENPFPNYDDTDSLEKLRERAESAIFPRLLDDQIPSDAMILEVGCGTGQLSNFLASKGGRTLFATDICLNSLALGESFRESNQINNAAFLQMNLFRPAFMLESFDYVICNGVLHHTADPFLGFQSISRLVKKGGFLIVGLYNKYGRIPTHIRRLIFRLSGDRFKFLDPRLRDNTLSSRKRHTWFMDQYKNPHESGHTFSEVLRYFDQSGVEFINSIPRCATFQPSHYEEQLFEANSRGSALERILVETGMLINGGSHGGFFVMIGRKSF